MGHHCPRGGGDVVVTRCALCLVPSTGSYAMRDLVSNLPSGQQRPAKNLEEDTVVAILNTIHEIVTDSSENARSLIQAQAVEKLVAINRTRCRTRGMSVVMRATVNGRGLGGLGVVRDSNATQCWCPSAGCPTCF